MKFTTALLVGVLLTATVAGCSDSESASTSPATDVAAVETTRVTVAVTSVAVTSVAASDPVSAPDPNAPGVGTEFCDLNQEFNDTSIFNGTSTPAQVEEYFTTAYPELAARFNTGTPAELTTDVALLQAGIDTLVAALPAKGWDLAAASNDPAVGAVLGSADYTAAGNRVDAYCGV